MGSPPGAPYDAGFFKGPTPVSSLSSLSPRAVALFALAAGVVTANAYYVHPIIGRVAETFGVSAAEIGAVPALNQTALALGVLFLLPLGDFVSNRKLVLTCLGVQLCALITLAVAQDYALFLAASTVLGFFTLTPYLLPAYVSKRVEAAQLGRATATLTTGVVAGVLLSRTGSGVIAQYAGWRAVYGVAACLMACALIILAWRLEGRSPSEPQPRTPYGRMILALGRLALKHPQVILSGAIQGLSFAIFLLLWLGLGLHLTGPAWNLGTDLVGGLSALTALNLFTTARLGRWADGLGAERARRRLALLQFIGVLTLALVHWHWLWVILPITLTCIAGPVIDVTGRMTALREDPAIRTRLMTLYTTIMFLLAGLGSALGTSTYARFGWNGIVLAAAGLSLLVLLGTQLGLRSQVNQST